MRQALVILFLLCLLPVDKALGQVASLQPPTGSIGTHVTIVGMGFGTMLGTVTFSGKAATPITWTPTSIVVSVPVGSTTGDVVVTPSGGMPLMGVAFTVITVNPASGAVATSVTISGKGFGKTQDTGTVYFNGIAATPTAWSDDKIAVPVPPGATTGIVIIVPAGASPMIGPTFTISSASTASDTFASLYTRAVVGFNEFGASSQSPQTKAFLEFNLTAPLFFRTSPTPDAVLAHETCLARVGQLNSTNAQSQNYQWSRQESLLQNFSKDCYPNDMTVQTFLLDSATTDQQITKLVRRKEEEIAVSDNPLSRRFWIWLNPRISSDPQQLSTALTSISSSSSAVTTALNQQSNQIVQSFDFIGGFAVTLSKPRPWFPFGDTAMQSFSLLGEAGLSAPLSSTANTAQIFTLNTNLNTAQLTEIFGSNPPTVCKSGQTPAANSCAQYVAFVPPDEPRFYKNYSAGFRISTYFFKNNKPLDDNFGLCKGKSPGEVCQIFPGTLDVTIGQNSLVTGGALRGLVLRIEAFYPLPFYPPIHLFFTTWTHLGKGNKAAESLPPLDTAGSTITVSTAGVQAVSLTPTNRDLYRIGVGLDLITFIQQLKSSSAKSSTTTAATAAAAPKP